MAVKTIRYGASGVTKAIVLNEVKCLRYTFTTLDVFWFVFLAQCNCCRKLRHENIILFMGYAMNNIEVKIVTNFVQGQILQGLLFKKVAAHC